ncbi:hypothetical protein F4781DRAFT_9251 [Annulohypoxylon bovei var. microspora]|nr:hypothetical protein F4781DRAFT_9251 [Annulohypoxylon bovei var. microspora]
MGWLLAFAYDQVTFNIETMSLATISFLDPLTLMSSVLGAVNRAVDMLRECQQIATKLRIPNLFITSLRTECSAIRLGLIQIKEVITKVESTSLQEFFQEDILEEYNTVLESCHLTFYILNKHMNAIGLRTMHNADRDALRLKLQALSRNSQMDEVSQAIMGLARGVRILCTAFEYENFSRATAVLSSPETKRVVDKISIDSVSLQDSFHMTNNRDGTSLQESEYDEQNFGIDDLLVNTTLYRRAFFRNLMKSQQDQIHDQSPRRPVEVSDDEQAKGTKLLSSFNVAKLEPRDTDSDTNSQTIPAEQNQSSEISMQQFSDEQETITTASQLSSSTYRISNNSEVIGGNPNQAPRELNEDLESLKSTGSESNSKIATADTPEDTNLQETPTRQMLLEAKYRSQSTRSSSSTAEDHLTVSGRLPTLFEVLSKRTARPYTLLEFYMYMRDIQKSIDYVDFWLDVVQHLNTCRTYVRELRRTVMLDSDSNSNDAFSLSELLSDSERHADPLTSSRERIRSSAEKIVYIYICRGAEREIVIPEHIRKDIVKQVDISGRDDPEVFDAAKDYVFQAMERDAFPGFLNLSRRPFRMFRKSYAIGSWINRVSLRGLPRTGSSDPINTMQRISPEELLNSLSRGRPGAPNF